MVAGTANIDDGTTLDAALILHAKAGKGAWTTGKGGIDLEAKTLHISANVQVCLSFSAWYPCVCTCAGYIHAHLAGNSIDVKIEILHGR